MGSAGFKGETSGARQPPRFLAVGRVVRPHGVRGALRVVALSDLIHSLTPSTKVYLGPDHESAIVRDFRSHGKDFLLFLERCEDRSSAEHWRDKVVHIRFEEAQALPEGIFYHWQILGLQVITQQGEILGEVTKILETGANDVYVVRDESGVELLLPAIESVILDVDLDKSCMTVNLLPGLRSNPSGWTS
jgi:16S rRNA processing protein RimM